MFVGDEEPIRHRTARCCCGQFSLEVLGEPIRVSMCHCFACQQRTGSVFGVQARFNDSQIDNITGTYSTYKRVGDGGSEIFFKFCPLCGSTLCWKISEMEGMTAIAVGSLSDPHIGTPTFSIYENRMHDWVKEPENITHYR